MTREIRRVKWHGKSSVAEAEELLGRGFTVELQLPPDFHHALLRHLGPLAKDSDTVNRSGGLELLGEIASISGLEDLALLSKVASDFKAAIRVRSPGPIVTIEPPEK